MKTTATLACALLALLSAPTQANTLIVDGASCTLQDAITAANTDTARGGCPAGSGPDVIELRSKVKLSSSEDGMDLTPPIEGQLTINGHSFEIVKTFGVSGRHFHVSPGATLTLNEVWLRFGSAQYPGGGAILNEAGGKLTINRSTISENDAGSESGGAIVNFGDVSINDSTIANNDAWIGGGMASGNPSGQLQHVFFANSTVTGNFAKTNTAFSMEGPVEVRLINVTMNENKGGVYCAGFCGDDQVTLLLSNTVMANSAAFPKFPPFIDETDCINAGPVKAFGTNLIEHDDGGCGASAFAFGTDPQLAPLAMNSGPTPTHVPLADSPVIDTTTCVVPTDQRGVTRPKSAGFCDIGAVEFGFIDTLLTKFDAKIAKGTLKSTGNTEPVRKAHKRDYRNLLLTARNSKIQKKRSQLCAKLKEAGQRLDTDGKIKPNEWVTGKPALGYAARIQRIQQSNGCR